MYGALRFFTLISFKLFKLYPLGPFVQLLSSVPSHVVAARPSRARAVTLNQARGFVDKERSRCLVA